MFNPRKPKMPAFVGLIGLSMTVWLNFWTAADPDLRSGADIYRRSCAVCHGAWGEGGAGPNLTDEYWIYGASFKDVYRVTKYGVPAKGMIPWKGTLNKRQLTDVTAYVLSLAGSNPPNAKAPEGERRVSAPSGR
jgi:mono/diheme cytochrome c family protein